MRDRNRQNPPIKQTPPIKRRCNGWADKRGSAIVLVLVSIVLMAILGATFLQVARFERIPRPSSNIEVVIAAVIDDILTQSTDDLLDANGKMFNITHNNTNNGGDEPWDFPYTRPGPQGTPQPGAYGRQAERINGQKVNVLGGAMDDTWLAATAPDFRTSLPPNTPYTNTDPVNGVWRKITSLTGLYLYGADGSSDLSSGTEPVEQPVTQVNGTKSSDMNIVVPAPDAANTTLVDADGDGIGDSRWEWASIRQIGTTRYVMAVRIIDLSARADLNVAMGRGYLDQGRSAIFTEPRGDSPVEMDGHTMVTQMAGDVGVLPATAQEHWRDLINYRMTGETTHTIPPVGATQPSLYDGQKTPPSNFTRRQYWLSGASRVAPNFTRNGIKSDPQGINYSSESAFGIIDAFELLRGNGLNSSNTTLAEDLMPDLLRRGAEEGNFVVENGSVTAQSWQPKQFWELDPRKQFSPFTGAMAVAPPLKANQDRRLKLDVNEAIKSRGGLFELRDRIKEVVDAGSGGSLLGPRGLGNHMLTSSDVANQLTANIRDFVDADNTISVIGDKAGLEALPYISEVYTQRLFVAGQPQPLPNGTQDAVGWLSPRAFVQGYAIEIGNPFGHDHNGVWQGRRVSLDKIYLQMGDRGTPVELSSLTSGKRWLEPGELLVLYHNSLGNAENPTLDKVNNLINAGPKVTAIDVTSNSNLDWPTDSTGKNLAIQLRAKVSIDGTAAKDEAGDFCYNAVEAQASIPQPVIIDRVSTGTIQQGYLGYVQTSYQGTGSGLRMMTFSPAARSKATQVNGYGDDLTSLDKPSVNCDTSDNGKAKLSFNPDLGKHSKSNDDGKYFQKLVEKNQQIVIKDSPTGRMGWIGDILQIPLIGPNPDAGGTNSSIALNFNKTELLKPFIGIEGLMLPYRTSGDAPTPPLALKGTGIDATVNDGLGKARGNKFGIHNIPHGLMLLEQLTTFNPATDGEDGDGEGGTESIINPNDNETLVPGKINLNTVSYQTLKNILPYPDEKVRESVASAIIARRESNNQQTLHKVGADGVPGIAYVSSLYEHLARLGSGGQGIGPYLSDSAASGNPGRDGISNTWMNQNNKGKYRIDWNDYEERQGSFPPPNSAFADDGIIDDREEELMLYKWLNELTNTRSDVFAAYIVVQGYSAEDFSGGPQESARLMIIFSRANVKEAGDQAIEIGRFRFK